MKAHPKRTESSSTSTCILACSKLSLSYLAGLHADPGDHPTD